MKKSPCYLDPTVLEQLAFKQIQENDILNRRHETLAGCMRKLPSGQRRLIQKYYRSDQTVKVFAEKQNRSAEATYKQLQRIRAALFTCVQRTLAQEEAL